MPTFCPTSKKTWSGLPLLPSAGWIAEVNSMLWNFTNRSTDASDAQIAALAAREEYLFDPVAESRNDIGWKRSCTLLALTSASSVEATAVSNSRQCGHWKSS